MFPRCFDHYKASLVVVTIYKVRESWVEKKIDFHVSLKQIREFFILALWVFFPNDLSLSHVASVNAEGVVFEDFHEFHSVLTQNQLGPSIHLLFTLNPLSCNIELKVEQFAYLFCSYIPIALRVILKVLVHFELQHFELIDAVVDFIAHMNALRALSFCKENLI